MKPDKDTLYMSSHEVCHRIEHLTSSMMSFWKSAHGWAPIEAAGLLSKAALDWQSSLSSSLLRWTTASSDGDLILAWANLGTLVEGQLKLFLSVFYEDYANSADAIKDKKDKLQDPGECTLDPLRKFFVKHIWTTDNNWDTYVKHVQDRRNAIHAFKPRNIGSFEDWQQQLLLHLSFVRAINGSLPYPDECFAPNETEV